MATPDSYINAAAGRAYWNSVGADVNGMLGGLPTVSKVDLQGSRAFLAKLGIGRSNNLRKVQKALEGGAGCVFDPAHALILYTDGQDRTHHRRAAYQRSGPGGRYRADCEVHG